MTLLYSMSVCSVTCRLKDILHDAGLIMVSIGSRVYSCIIGKEGEIMPAARRRAAINEADNRIARGGSDTIECQCEEDTIILLRRFYL